MGSFTLTKKLLVFFTLKVQLPVFLQTKATFLFTVSVTLLVKCPAVATVQVSASKEKASRRLIWEFLQRKSFLVTFIRL